MCLCIYNMKRCYNIEYREIPMLYYIPLYYKVRKSNFRTDILFQGQTRMMAVIFFFCIHDEFYITLEESQCLLGYN